MWTLVLLIIVTLIFGIEECRLLIEIMNELNEEIESRRGRKQ